MNYTINEERLTSDEYIDFLKKTDLGSQYPKERFYEKIGMKKPDDVMMYNHIEWTNFTVE